jgi:CRISPR-associated protein Cas6
MTTVAARPSSLPPALEAAQLAAACTVDLAFELDGRALPHEHRAMLADALQRALPWLADEPHAGVHALRAPAGEDGLVLLPRRARLLLRLPAARLAQARALCGQRLDVDGHPLQVGAAAPPRELALTRTLYADFVCWDAAIEPNEADEPFDAQVAGALAGLGVTGQWISGGERSTPAPVPAGRERGPGRLRGRALVLHDLPQRHALALQVLGLGRHRLLGCGLFVPHKAITGLSSTDD